MNWCFVMLRAEVTKHTATATAIAHHDQQQPTMHPAQQTEDNVREVGGVGTRKHGIQQSPNLRRVDALAVGVLGHDLVQGLVIVDLVARRP